MEKDVSLFTISKWLFTALMESLYIDSGILVAKSFLRMIIPPALLQNSTDAMIILQALLQNSTDAMRESRVLDIINAVWLLLSRKCAIIVICFHSQVCPLALNLFFFPHSLHEYFN